MAKFIRNLLALIAVLFISFLASYAPLSAADPCTDNCLIQEFSIPGSPLKIVNGEADQRWFTMPISNAIGSLVVESSGLFTFTDYIIPTANSQPYDLVYDSQAQAIWFTEEGAGQIGKLDLATGSITEFPIPTADSQPRGIDIAPDGTIWFVERASNTLGHFNPATSTFEEFVYTPRNSTGNVELEDVVVENNNSIWFSAPLDHEVIQFRPGVDPEVQFAPTYFGADRRPFGLALNAAGTLWATDAERGEIRKYVPGTLVTWIQYALEPSTSEPLGIAIQGNEIFVAARDGALLARAVDGRTSQRNVQQFGLSEGAEPTSIVIDNTGTVWATDPARNVIMRWQAPYFLNTWLPVTIND